MKSHATKFLVLFLFLGLIYSNPVRAQVSGATLLGTITDAQGGVVADAKVSARNTATGVTSDTTTNSSGSYSIVNLIPGAYDVSITAQGFSTSVSKVTLTVGAKQELSLALTVGQVSQTVEVTGAAPLVETTDATLSGNVEGSQIQQLPLNGRDWVSLAELTPGVVSVRPHEEVDAPGGSTRGLGIQMTINGARPQQNVYRLNGVIVNDYSNAGPGNVLGKNAGVDAIQEFSVLTGNYSAEYGDTSGGVINAITKSGTNSLHGSVYEFMRNSALDAANRFEDPNPQNPAGLQKGNFVRNQFGASGGWKILKDKAFLFGNYEGLRQAQAIPQQAVVLTSNARLGILNDACGNGPGTAYASPGKSDYGKCNVVGGGAFVPMPILAGACPFAGLDPNGMTNEAPGRASVCVDNFIFAQINPNGTPPGVLAQLPNGALLLPNNNDNAYLNSNNTQYSTDNYSTVRGDVKISDNDSLSASWYRDTSTWRKPGTGTGTFLTYSGFQVPHSAYTLDETHIFSATLVNDLRLGLATSDLFSPAFSNANPVSHATTISVNGATVQIGILPGWVAGGGSIGGNGNSGNSTKASGAGGGFTGAAGFSSRTSKIEVFDDISKTVGRHTLKFGVMAVDDHEDWLSGPAGKGGGGPSYNTIKGACDGSDPLTVLVCGGGVASYLSNIPTSVRMPIEPPFAPIGTVHHWRSQIYAGYFQDDWKMASNLTVNLGLRYEMTTVPYVTDNNINNVESLNQNLPNVSTPGACVADVNGHAACPGFYHSTFQSNPTLANFEPRIGFAWDPFKSGKTSIRGGVGIFDVLPLSYMFALNSLQVAPSAAETDLAYCQTFACIKGGTSGIGHFPTTEASDVTDPTKVSNSGAAQRWQFVEPNPKRNYVLQYNLNVQRQITPTVTIMVAYAGSRSWHDPLQSDDLNTVVPYFVNGRYLWPNPVGSGCTNAAGVTNIGGVNYATGNWVKGDCSGTLSALGYTPSFIPGTTLSANPTITPGVLINSHTAQFQSTVFPVQSWYNALQVKIDKNLSHGLLVGGSFSWGKSFDTSSSSFASDNYANNPSAIVPWWDLSIDRGLSDFNVTKNVSINFLYTIPTPGSFNGFLKSATEGWGIGANFQAADGIPLWPLMVGGDSLGMDITGAYAIPDLVPGCQQVNSNARTGALQYLNPACYTVPNAPSQAFFNAKAPLGCDGNNNPATLPSNSAYSAISAKQPLACFNLLGNDPRNNVIGPGLINLDFSVTKDTYVKRISEAFDVQFRAEMFNIANHPNYAFPAAGNLGSLDTTGNVTPGFGTLTKTQSTERQIQFALKVIF